MSNFIFKVPEPPEDARRKRRKIDNLLRPEYSHESWNNGLVEFNDSSQMSLRNNKMNHKHPRPMKDINLKDHLEASTSYHKSFIRNHDQFNSFQSLFTRYEKSKTDDKMRSKCFLNSSESRFNSDFSSSSQNISDITSETGVYNNNNNTMRRMNISSVVKSNWNNSLNVNSQLRTKNPVFNTFFLPQKNSFQDLSMKTYQRTINSRINQSSSLNRTNLQKNSSLLLNSYNNRIDNEIMMKSLLQTSVVSLKEQVMNALENFGHLVLSNANDKDTSTFQYAFHKIVKEMKQIFENNVTFMDSFKDRTTMSYKSETLCAPQQIIMGSEGRIHDHCGVPNDTLHNLIFNQNKSVNYQVKPHFIETFTVEKKKRSYNSDNIQEKSENHIAEGNGEELNIKNWYPVVLRDGLAFVGISDKNKHIETLTMKKRLSNRKIQLIDGFICNLIGSPSKDIKFPLEISSKIKNGLHPHWRLLMDAISKFQKKSLDKGNKEVKSNKVVIHRNKSSTKTSTTLSNKRKSKKRQSSLINKSPNPTTIITKKELQKEIENNSDILKVTRSGRVSKRPGNLWIGTDIHKTNKKNISFHSNEKITQFTSNKSSCKLIKATKSNRPECEDEVKPLAQKSSKLPKKKRKEKNCKLQSDEDQNTELQKVNVVPGSTNKNIKKKFLRCSPVCANSVEQEFEEQLNDIMIPEISSRSEEAKLGNKKIKTVTLETPPLKFFRNNLKILGSCTPVQSPNWQISQHSQSEVKKFEQIRSKNLKQKYKHEKKVKNPVKVKNITRNKDVETVMKWISEKEVKSPKKGSKVVDYMMAKRHGLDSDEESDET